MHSKIWLFCIVSCLAMVGCPGGKPQRSMPNDEGKMVLRVINGAEAATMDPVKREGVPGTHILANLFEGLVRVNNKNGGYLPGVAKTWEISSDGTVYTFFLRKNAKWSDGKLVTAHDFVASYRRALDPLTESRNASLFFNIKNAQNLLEKIVTPEELGVVALDDFTLKIELENAAGYFLSMLSLVPFYATPHHVVKEYGNSWTDLNHIVSNGPFRLSSRRQNDRTEAVKNEQYWGKDEVKLDKIIFFTTDDGNTRLRMFQAYEADFHVTGLAPQAYPQIKQNPEWVSAPRLGTYYYIFNTKKAPFNNAKFRQAISMAIDRKIITDKVLNIGYLPAYSLVPPGTNNYKSTHFLEENIEKAKELIKEAGYGNIKDVPSITILFNTDESHKKVALVISNMLKLNLGIEVKVENAEWKTYLDRRRHGNYDISRAGWIGDYNDADSFIELCYSKSENGDTFWGNAEYDKLFLQSRIYTNQEERMVSMQKAEKILLQEMPLMPIYFYIADTLVKPYVKNLYPRNSQDVANGFFDLQARAIFRDSYIDMAEKKKYFEQE